MIQINLKEKRFRNLWLRCGVFCPCPFGPTYLCSWQRGTSWQDVEEWVSSIHSDCKTETKVPHNPFNVMAGTIYNSPRRPYILTVPPLSNITRGWRPSLYHSDLWKIFRKIVASNLNSMKNQNSCIIKTPHPVI